MSKLELMLDSGAFTAWKQNTQVNLDAYIEYVKAHERKLFAYVNLDVIPGTPDNPKGDPEAAAMASDVNLQRMLDAGLKPIPVFHQNEGFKWLVKMLNDGHDYIGISPSGSAPTDQRTRWLDEVYTLLCDAQGRPYVKTHGFGVTSPEILTTYPFYSADSTTWALLSGHGGAFIPRWTGEDWDFTGFMRLKFSQGMQIKVLESKTRSGGEELGTILEYLRRGGFKIETLSEDYQERARLLLFVFTDMVEWIGKNPVLFDYQNRSKIYLKGVALPRHLKLQRPWKLRLFHVAWAAKAQWLLQQSNITERLVSYIHTRDWKDDDLELLSRTGLVGGSPLTGKQRLHPPKNSHEVLPALLP